MFEQFHSQLHDCINKDSTLVSEMFQTGQEPQLRTLKLLEFPIGVTERTCGNWYDFTIWEATVHLQWLKMQGTIWSFTYFVPYLKKKRKKCLGLTVTGLVFSRIISTHSLSFSITTWSASLTNFRALLPQQYDCSCYVSRPILAPSQLWLKKQSDLSAHDFAHFEQELAKMTYAWRWRICGINPATPTHIGGIPHADLRGRWSF